MPRSRLDTPDTLVDEVVEVEEVFGRYRLCLELASGGMGKVYLANVEMGGGLEKLVALKRIHPHLADKPEFVHMFLDEARIASRISHPNVCTVFDFGEEAGSYFIAMEYLLGQPLSRLVARITERSDRGGPERWLIGARIIADACEGLHAAHELADEDGRPLDVVHRDVSPHNLFVTYAGSVKVVDFGIARAADQLHQTTTGAVKGKWSYMAPEQARGNVVDRRADVWSLGVVLWELCAARHLFRRRTETATVLALTQEEIARPSEVADDVPEALDEVVMGALRRDPAERYATARDFGRALGKFLAYAGHSVGLAEVGEYTRYLCPHAEAEQGKLVERARTMVSAEALQPSLDAPSKPDTRVDLPRARTASQMPTTPMARPVPLGVAARRPRSTVRIALGVATVVMALLAVAWIAVPTPPVVTTTVEAAPRPARDEAPDALESAPVRGVSEREEETVAAPPAPEPPAPAPAAAPAARAARPAASPSSRRPSKASASDPSAVDPPARAPVGRGTVNVVTPGGWALVFEGGRNLGETPASLSLEAGEHVLQIRPFGREPGVHRRVDVEADRTQRVVVPVSRDP